MISSRIRFVCIRTLCLFYITMLLGSCGEEQASVLRGPDVPDDWPQEFTLAFFMGGDAAEVVERQDPVRGYLQEHLQIPVHLHLATNYSAVVEAVRSQRADAMMVGPLAYVLAVEEANVEALGIIVADNGEQSNYEADTDSVYFSAIVTRKGSGIETLEDLRGKNLAFVDPASMSGHLAPRNHLIKNGIDPETDLNAVFAGAHPTVLLSVNQGRVDAGATMLGNLYRLEREGMVDFCGFREGQIATPEVIAANYAECPEGGIALIALTDPIPGTPFAIRADLPESFKAAVKQALLATKLDAALQARMPRPSHYIDPSEEYGYAHLDEHYNSVRQLANLLDLDLQAIADQ